jgi:hypothetical protein
MTVRHYAWPPLRERLLLQPEILLTDELANGKLVRVLTDFAPQPRRVAALSPSAPSVT